MFSIRGSGTTLIWTFAAVSVALSGCGGGAGGGTSPVSMPVATSTPTAAPSATLPPSGATMTAYAATPPPITYTHDPTLGIAGGVAVASDGTIYTTQNGAVVKSVNGAFSKIPWPSPYKWPAELAIGSDGAAWIANENPGPPSIIGAIARVAADGTVTEYAIPTLCTSEPEATMLGPDGNIWFTEFYQGAIARITPQGVVTEFSLGSTSHRPSGIATGPDGNLWVVESAHPTIERVSPSGQVLNTYPSGAMMPFHITRGSDNAMWFVDAQNGIGRIDMSGNISEWYLPCDVPNVGNFCVPGYFQSDTDIVLGPDGALWFTAANFNAIARMTTQGLLTEWPVPPTSLGSAAPSRLTALGSKIYFVGCGNFLGTITP